MNQNKKIPCRIFPRVVTVLSVTFSLVAISAANAQPPNDTANELSQEQLTAAWKLQAETVAATLQLPDPKKGPLTKVYLAARKRQQEGQQKIASAESDPDKQRAASDEFDQEQRKALREEFKGILGSEQGDAAVRSLGTFSSRWDLYVNVLATFKLNDGKQTEALNLVNKYIVDHGAAVREARSSGGRLTRNRSSELKKKLDDGLAQLLTAEQLSDWNKASAFRGRSSSAKAPVGEKTPGDRKPANRKDSSLSDSSSKAPAGDKTPGNRKPANRKATP